MTDLIDAIAAHARTDPHATLDEHAWLGDAIDDDRDADLFVAWGRSTVIDENTRTSVIDPPLFAALHDRARIDARWPVGNAGLLHVYGYLLSTVTTPYGLKRERWLSGELARAYGLQADAFVPWAQSPSTTLLARVTDAASRAIDRDAVRTTDRGATLAFHRATGAGPWALTYALGGRLITAFPVASTEAILAEWDADPDRLRWNAAGG